MLDCSIVEVQPTPPTTSSRVQQQQLPHPVGPSFPALALHWNSKSRAMMSFGRALAEVARLGQAGVRMPQARGRLERRRLGSLSLGSAADRRATAGVDARRPTRTMELRRAEEVQKCADKGWKSALICLGNMRKGGVSPGSAAYNVALKACAGAGEWDRAAAILADMQGTGGATPDANLVLEIEEALAAEGAGEGGTGAAGGEGKGVLLGDLSCDSTATAVASSSSGPDAASRSQAGGSSSVRSMGGGLGSGGGSASGGGSRGSVAGMHTTAALRATGSGRTHRPAEAGSDDDGDGSSSRTRRRMRRSMSSISMSSGGSRGSTTSVHTIVALGADSAWPSRRSPRTTHNGDDGSDIDNNHAGGSNLAGSGPSRSPSWDGWRLRNRQDIDQRRYDHREKGNASHAEAFCGGRGFEVAGQGEEKESAWPSSPTAPFAGSWGDD